MDAQPAAHRPRKGRFTKSKLWCVAGNPARSRRKKDRLEPNAAMTNKRKSEEKTPRIDKLILVVVNCGRLDHSMKIPDIFGNYGRFRGFCKGQVCPARNTHFFAR